MALRSLYHWTHRDNVPSIMREGLRPDLATGSMKAVWMVPALYRSHAAFWCCARHGWHVSDLVLLKIDVSKIRPTKRSGEWHLYTKWVVSPSALSKVGSRVTSRLRNPENYF